MSKVKQGRKGWVKWCVCIFLLCTGSGLVYWSYLHCDALTMTQVAINKISESMGMRMELVPYTKSEGVIFLKTHKTAGSTVTSIMWRNLCENEGRNCFLPPYKNPGKTWDFSRSSDWDILRRYGGSSLRGNATSFYSAWLLHAVFSPKLFSIVPRTKRIISIVRRPSHRFESAWHWYNHSSKFHMELSQFATRVSAGTINLQLFKYRTGLDATTEEMTGIRDFRSKIIIQKSAYEDLIGRVLRRELVLLVAERLEESLLVLGRLLGWTAPQLISLPLKVGTYKKVNEETYIKLDQIQTYDFGLWKLANSVLTKLITDNFEPEDFNEQLATLSRRNKNLQDVCNMNPHSGECERLNRDNSLRVKLLWKSFGFYG